MKRALVLGAGGFIGNHLVDRLKSEGYWVRGVDIKYPEYQEKSNADEFLKLDLRNHINMFDACFISSTYDHGFGPDRTFDEIYQLAADMGGAGYIFSGEHDADVMINSSLININLCNILQKVKLFNENVKVFYSSSACMYPEHNQLDPNNPNCEESSAYPANPDSEYGWEKLFSERLYLSMLRNYNINIKIARFHNIFGPKGTWRGGKEKAPAAICRKVIEASPTGFVEVWGDGEQTRSFLYIDECLEGIRRLMDSDFHGPVNIGSEEKISINDLVLMAAKFEDKNITLIHIDGPLGVRGRNSDNKLIFEKLGWKPTQSLEEGLRKTYFWIKEQLKHV